LLADGLPTLVADRATAKKPYGERRAEQVSKQTGTTGVHRTTPLQFQKKPNLDE
jgi:hypothetical protein